MHPAEPLRRPSPWPRLALWTGLGALTISLSTLAAYRRDHALLINVSPSLPYWALWLERGVAPARGDIILFDPPASPLLVRHFGAEPRPFGKRVSGMPGDLVSREDRAFFVNGRRVATAKRKSRLGEPLGLGPTGTVPRGCYFATTAHKDGFDSRYAAIGWICAPRILGIGRPIL